MQVEALTRQLQHAADINRALEAGALSPQGSRGTPPAERERSRGRLALTPSASLASRRSSGAFEEEVRGRRDGSRRGAVSQLLLPCLADVPLQEPARL